MISYDLDYQWLISSLNYEEMSDDGSISTLKMNLYGTKKIVQRRSHLIQNPNCWGTREYDELSFIS